MQLNRLDLIFLIQTVIIMRVHIKRLFQLIFFIPIVIFGCLNNSQNDSVKINALNEGLMISNSLIRDQIKGIYVSLEQKLQEYGSKEKAIIWYPKAMLIKMYSDSIRNFIEGLKTDLRNAKNKENIIDLLFEKNNKGSQLYNKLLTYKNSILAIDPELKKVFKNKIVVTTEAFDSLNHNMKDFTKNFFHETSKEMALGILNKFENNVSITELETITFCHYHTTYNDESFTILSTLVWQNIKYARPGEIIKILAGVGAYSTKCNPHIKINGITIPVSNGVADYRFKVKDKPGKYFVPVIIDYTDENGKKQSVTSNIDYFVN
jgi:gliding motility-associated GldM-like protein